MKNYIKFYLTLILTFLFLFTSISYSINALSDIHIIQDSDTLSELPKHFRKTTDISKATALKSIDITGLCELNISGSGQFTKSNLPLLIENIDSNFTIIDIDLREESHGFINDIAISFSNLNNNANTGLNLDEIIKKENKDLSSIKLNKPLTLYNNKKNIVDFYVGEIYKFLNNFYKRCKNDEITLNNTNIIEYTTLDSENTTSLTCTCNYSYENTDSYIKNTIIPEFLYVISENDMTKAEQTMIATLQGLIASKSSTQIYILSPSEPDYKIWLKDLNKNYNVKYKSIKNPWKLLDKFKEYINGYVLYSTVKSPSINNACTLASLNDSIAIDESIEYMLNTHGITNLIKDCRETDKYWAFNNLWNSGLNHSTVIELSSDKYMPLRDYAILSKSLIFYEDDINDSSLREIIFKSIDDGGRILGWGPDEHTNVSIASKFGVDMIASDWSYNLSVLSSYPSTPKVQNIKNEFVKEDGFHYVTFIMSDGDNQQWLLGSNFSMKNWFGSPYRGNFNLGWSLSPSLYYLAPTVFNKYYEAASSSKYNDNYIVAASGNGYMYPSKFPYEKLSDYTEKLNDYMGKVDQNYVLILDDEAFYKKELWDKYTCNSNIDGLLYLNYDRNNAYEGKIIWSNNKPIISCRDLLWSGLEDQNELIANITNRVNLGYTNINDSNSYTFVYVHVWSNTMDNVNDVVNKLNSNPKVKIVTPDTFVKLIKENISPTI